LRHQTGFSNKKNQTPSYCDRILIKSQPSRTVKIKEYNSAEMYFGSDHRPVYGIYEVLVEPPFLPLPALHLRNMVPRALLKFNKLILDYAFVQFQTFHEFEGPLPPNVELSMSFTAKFLDNYPSTLPLKIIEKCGPWQWNEEMLPLIHIPFADSRYLKTKYIRLHLTTINEDQEEVLLGQASIPLIDVVSQACTLTNFTTPIHLYGKEFGSLYGEFTFDFADEISSEVFDFNNKIDTRLDIQASNGITLNEI